MERQIFLHSPSQIIRIIFQIFLSNEVLKAIIIKYFLVKFYTEDITYYVPTNSLFVFSTPSTVKIYAIHFDNLGNLNIFL
jgi:hypothetical protein